MVDSQDTTNEEWRKATPGFQNYSVSNLGNVRNDAGDRWGKNKGRAVKSCIGSRGYAKVTLRDGDAKGTFNVHRLVATAFVANPLGKPDVNHIDGKKTNNAAENLEWVTKKENHAHATATGLTPTGSRHWSVRMPGRIPRGESHWRNRAV